MSFAFPSFSNLKNLRCRVVTTAMLSTLGIEAHAQSYNQMFSGFKGLLCSVIGPFTGTNGTMLSLIVICLAAVFAILWWLSENKEGPLMWLIKAGLVVSVLINIFTLPGFFGLAPVTCP